MVLNGGLASFFNLTTHIFFPTVFSYNQNDSLAHKVRTHSFRPKYDPSLQVSDCNFSATTHLPTHERVAKAEKAAKAAYFQEPNKKMEEDRNKKFRLNVSKVNMSPRSFTLSHPSEAHRIRSSIRAQPRFEPD